jgi:hypothetical protein
MLRNTSAVKALSGAASIFNHHLIMLGGGGGGQSLSINWLKGVRRHPAPSMGISTYYCFLGKKGIGTLNASDDRQRDSPGIFWSDELEPDF